MCVAVLVGPDEACGCSMTEHIPWYCLCLAYHTSEQVPSLLTYLPVISNLVWPWLAGSRPRWTGNLPLFTLHVLRNLVCVRITFQTTGPSPPALGASSTSSRLLDLTGTGRWHRSRVPKVLLRAGALVVVRGGQHHGQHSRPCALPQCCSRCIRQLPYVQVRCRASSDTVPSRAVDTFMSVCHHSPTAMRLGSTREWVHGACVVGRV